jgi:hypothetical protein
MAGRDPSATGEGSRTRSSACRLSAGARRGPPSSESISPGVMVAEITLSRPSGRGAGPSGERFGITQQSFGAFYWKSDHHLDLLKC